MCALESFNCNNIRFIASAAILAATTFSVSAQEYVSFSRPVGKAAPPERVWTSSDYANAKGMQKTPSFLPNQMFDLNSAARERNVSGSGQVVQGHSRPAANPVNKEVTLFRPTERAISPASSLAGEEIAPNAVGTGGLRFTSSRVAAFSPDERHYPRNSIGKLFYETPAGIHECSASLIKPGIIVTAGHCVHSGNGANSGYFRSFRFAPAFRNGMAPYGLWDNYVAVYTSQAWYVGGGTVPNTGDWALIVFNPDSKGRRIGDYTGWLGFQIDSMIGQQVSAVGYPENLDFGNVMHRVDAFTTSFGAFNNGTFGSDMRGGSSGGPILKNFRLSYLRSDPRPSDDTGNLVVATVSWGYTINTANAVQGASQFDGRFQTLVNAACHFNPLACN